MIDSIAGIDLETKVRIFLDNTLAVRQILDKDNALNLQDDLEKLYNWANKSNMAFNGTKFECIKYGPNLELKESYNYSNPEIDTWIEDKTSLRDLGIQVSEFATYDDHISNVHKIGKTKICMDQ